MARVCQITGKKRMIGNNVSHSKRRTKREFAPNLKTKRFWSEEEQRFVTLKVSVAGIRTINKNGLAAALKSAQAKGLIDLV
ncbi:MAG: 50S ribosomal protein L28 [Bacteroidales bacterium]|nr:50S ribosomal protein L28 [Bacteroidales bacterium]